MRPSRLLPMAALAFVFVSALGAQDLLKQTGRLVEGDGVLDDGRLVDWHRVSLAAGTRYLFHAGSDELDTAVLLRFSDGARLENDDYSGTDAALVYAATRAESVEVGVSSSSAGLEGAYELTVRRMTPAKAIQTGQALEAALGPEADVTIDDDGWVVASYLFTGGRGDRVTVRLASSDFDAYLRLQSRDGLELEIDDIGNSTDAELEHVFAGRSQIEITVRATSPSEGGDYELQVDRSSGARDIAPGGAFEGRLAAGAQDFLLDGRSGQAFFVSASSDDFDPMLTVTDHAGRRSVNDDWEGETNAGLVYLFPSDGTVVLSVTRTEDGNAEPYRLSVEPRELRSGSFRRSGMALEHGDTVRAFLDLTAGRRDNRYTHSYTFEAEPNELFSVSMASEEFDAYLEVTGPDGFEVSDDDSGGDYDAYIEATAPEAGRYVVSATTTESWTTGFYELSFERGGLVAPAMDVEGRLERRDPRDLSGRHYDVHTLDVEEGSSITVDLVSEDFDAYLFVWDPSGEEILQDDDGGGDTSARVEVDDAEEGTWTIYATSNQNGESGAYRLRVLMY